MFRKGLAILAVVCIITSPLVYASVINWTFTDDTGLFTNNGGVWTGTQGQEGNIWVDMELQDGQQWNVIITEHNNSGFIVFGIYPRSLRQNMIDCPTCRRYMDVGSHSMATDNGYLFQDGTWYPSHPGMTGNAPLYGDNVGHIWTLTYNTNTFQIDNLSSGGERVILVDIDPNEKYMPFSMVHGTQTHYYDDVTGDNNDDCIQWGNQCLTAQEIQQCHNHLGLLSANGDSVDNVCEDDSNGEITFYNFLVSYNDPFYLHDCLDHRLYFQGTELIEGTNQFDQWQFDPNTQQLRFSIKHLDLEPYGCILAVSDEEYEWQCEMRLDIEFAGVVQYEYAFFMKVFLSRTYTDSLTVSVERNRVTGDCCENRLEIETTLKWCETFACNAYLSNPLTIERKSDMYVEHSIVSTEFQYYFLHGLSIKLGPFVPTIHNRDGSQAGRYIWHISSNVAMGNMELVVISRIDENPSRRQLTRKLNSVQAKQTEGGDVVGEEDNDLGDDYKVKASEYVTVYDTEGSGKDSSESESSGSEALSIGAIIGITVVACLVVSGSVVGGIYLFKKRSLKMESPDVKYQVDNNLSAGESDRKLSVISN